MYVKFSRFCMFFWVKVRVIVRVVVKVVFRIIVRVSGSGRVFIKFVKIIRFMVII